MAKLRIIGKNGVFVVVKKGRLMAGAEVCNRFADALLCAGTNETVELDPGAVVLLRKQLQDGEV
jgi:hypothetical protein